MDYCSALKKKKKKENSAIYNKDQKTPPTCVDLEDIMLSEINQSWKEKYHMILLL